jgi:TM2 domain-containing membrane protein YozV
MGIFPDRGTLSADASFDGELRATRLEGKRKKRRYGYLAWLCLGSHYFYLGRPATQAIFWLTGGGLLLWWLADLFRIPGLVRRRNLRATREMLEQWHQSASRYVPEPRPADPWAGYASARPAPVPGAEPFPSFHHVDGEAIASRSGSLSGARAGAVLAAALAAMVTMYVLAPPPLASLAASEPSFRTVRSSNVRAGPSTTSPLRAVARKGAALHGQVEKVGDQHWLWITRGSHADGYVAVSNLEPR